MVRSRYVLTDSDELVGDLLRICRYANEASSAEEDEDAIADEILRQSGDLFLRIAEWAMARKIGSYAYNADPASKAVFDDFYIDDDDFEVADIGHSAIRNGIRHAPPHLLRGMLIAALHPAFYANRVLADLAEDLQALDHGEVRPAMTPAATGRHGAGLTLAMLQVRAVACVEYLAASGMTKEKAWRRVAEAHCQSTETLISWSKRLPKKFGSGSMAASLDFARALGAKKPGEAMYELGVDMFSDEHIAEYGAEYLKALRDTIGAAPASGRRRGTTKP